MKRTQRKFSKHIPPFSMSPAGHQQFGFARESRAKLTVLCAAVLLAVSTAGGQDNPVTEVGDNLVKVTVVGQGLDRREALRNAHRKAVERGAGTYIHSQSKTKDFVLVRDTILTRSTGFLQSYEILSTGKPAEEGDFWQMKIEAVVSIKGIEDAWGVTTALLKQMGRPKIMVFINEQIDERINRRIRRRVQESSTVQTRIENLLLKNGFLLVDKSQLKAIDRKDLAAAVADNKPAKAQAIAKRFGAQLFISGAATAAYGGTTVRGLMYRYEAEANVKCYRSDTAQLMSSIPGVPTPGVQRVQRSAAKQALDYQAKQIAPKVRNQILRFWQDVLEGRGEVQLHVDGASFRQYLKLKKLLKGIQDVSDITGKYRNKTVECSIESALNAEALAEKIVEHIETLEITDVSQNVIKATMSRE